MTYKTFVDGFKAFVKLNFLTRITSIMLKGTLGQKVAVVLGIFCIIFGIYKTFIWLLLMLGGYLVVFLAFKDFDSMTRPS